MLNFITNQVDSINPNPDSGLTRVQQLLRVVEETCPFNVAFNEKFPNHDWDGTRKSWEVFFQRKEVQSGLGFIGGKPRNNSANLIDKVELFTQAVELTSLNIPVFPCTTDKKHYPFLKGFRQKLYNAPLSVSRLLNDYKNTKVKGKDGKLRDVAGLAILTGPISPKHDLVAFDFEFPELKEKFISAVEAELPNLVDAIKETYWETTAGGGHHFFALVPSGQGKDTKLARKKTGKLDEKGNEKLKDLIEIKGKGNSYIIIAPSRAESKKSGVKAIGQYKPTNGPLINNNGLRAVTLDLEDFESLKAICRSLDEMPRRPEAKPQSVQKTINQSPFNLSGNPEGDWVVLNQFLRERWGWPKVAEKFGFRIHSNKGPGYWYAFHPNTNDFTITNVQLGPKDSNSKDVCYIHSTNETLSYYQVWKNYGGSMAELYKLAENAGYKIPQDTVDETRWGFTDHGKDKPWSGNEEADLQYWKMVDSITPKNPENLINIVGLDLLDVCDEFENPIISKVSAVSILAQIFGIFHAVNKEYGIRFYANLQQLILADSCIGKSGPSKYAARLFARLSEAIKEKFDALDDDIKVAIKFPDLNGSISEFGLGGSAQGLQDKFRRMQAVLVLVNEMADFFEARSNGNKVAEEQLGMMKELSTTPTNRPSRDLSTTGLTSQEIENQTAEIKAPILNVLAFAQSDRMKQKGVMLEKDFSGGNISRILAFPEPRKTRFRRDGTMNIPKRPGGDPSDEVLEKILARVLDLVLHGGVTEISKEACERKGRIVAERWLRIYPKENAGTYIASTEGRGPEDAFKIAFIHSLCKPKGWETVGLEDLDFGFAYEEAGKIQASELYKVVMGSPLQKYVDEFMKFAVRSKEPNRSGILNQWKYRGKSTDKKDAVWVRDILEPELEKLGLIRVIDKKAGTYEVITNGR